MLNIVNKTQTNHSIHILNNKMKYSEGKINVHVDLVENIQSIHYFITSIHTTSSN